MKRPDSEFLDTTQDGKFKAIPYLKYLPWVGLKYRASLPSERLLIVAESVYDSGNGSDAALKMLDDPCFARYVLKEQGLFFTLDQIWQGARVSKLLRGIERALLGKRWVTEPEQERLWTSISFHEFVQRHMKDRYTRPTKGDYQVGAKVLCSVIALLEPSVVLFLGTDWRKFQAIESECECKVQWHEKINGSSPKIIEMKSDGRGTKIIMIRHPSKYFSWSKWHELTKKEMPGVVAHLGSL